MGKGVGGSCLFLFRGRVHSTDWGMVSEKTNEFRTVGELTLMSFFSGAIYSLSSSATVQQW